MMNDSTQDPRTHWDGCEAVHPLCAREKMVQAIIHERNTLYQECARLQSALNQAIEARDDYKSEVAWFESLVKRAKIGTAKTPSLRAYIEQLEQGGTP